MRIITACSFIVLLTHIISCKPSTPKQNYDEGDLKENTYSSEEIGWTIEIPEGWKIVEREKLDENLEMGKEAIGEVVDYNIDYSGMKNLISFEKDEFNALESTSETFPLNYEGQWEENNQYLKQLLYDTYTNQGISLDTSSSETTIDGLEFQVYRMTLYQPDGSLLLHQDMYSRYINGNDFGVTLTYNTEENRKEMEAALNASTFEKR